MSANDESGGASAGVGRGWRVIDRYRELVTKYWLGLSRSRDPASAAAAAADDNDDAAFINLFISLLEWDSRRTDANDDLLVQWPGRAPASG